MATVSLKNIKKVYPFSSAEERIKKGEGSANLQITDEGVVAVQAFSMDIADKEFIVLVGPSGCGKSTTLRMIAGLEEITDGELYIDGELVNYVDSKERDISMVFQNYALFPHMTVYENMAFPLTLRHERRDVIDRKVREAAAILDITDYLQRKPKALSGGQRQRVAIGRAIIRKVGVFLMDEPLSNLDAKQRVTMRYEIAQIHQETGATTIYVTHDQTEAMTLADRIVVMKDGYVQQIGTPYELYHKPANVFVAGFIGEPPMNFVRGIVKNGYISMGDNVLNLKAKYADIGRYEGKEIVFGFRPEAIKLGEADNACVVKCRVELTEMLGDNTNVYITAGDKQAILKVDSHDTPETDTEISFFIPWESIYLFDGETEKVL